jgi:hypothetical protein
MPKGQCRTPAPEPLRFQTPIRLPDVRCPKEQVLEESGKRVEELVQDVDRFAAVEQLFHERLDKYGIPSHMENRKYNYVANISEPRAGIIDLTNFGAKSSGCPAIPSRSPLVALPCSRSSSILTGRTNSR